MQLVSCPTTSSSAEEGTLGCNSSNTLRKRRFVDGWMDRPAKLRTLIPDRVLPMIAPALSANSACMYIFASLEIDRRSSTERSSFRHIDLQKASQ